MARLNDPPQPSSDSYETLRKKLMRQNKDLARSNSIQSLKIRQLDNDCARLLSENLDLRGQVLRLEKELEDSRLQRIADHALEIKAKMEAQLVEWGSLLAGLGMEPPAKRRDHVGRRQSQRPRTSMTRRSPLKTLRDVARDLEALEALEARAKEEGRLTPIREVRTSSRQTLDNDEILALRSEAEAADISGSSDLGPPPISQFIDEDEVKGLDSQNELAPNPEPAPEPVPDAAPEPHAKPEEKPEAEPETKPEAPKPASRRPSATKTIATSSNPKPPPSPVSIQDLPTPSVKAGSKRKLGVRDDAENSFPTSTSTPVSLAPSRRKSAISKERTGGVSQKEPAALQRTKDQSQVGSAPTRKPLAVKSTNEDMNTPQKPAKKLPDDSKVPKTLKQMAAKGTSRRKTTTASSAPAEPAPPSIETQVVIATTELEKPAVTVVDVLSPMTPKTHLQIESRGDTPPPADISWKGEAARPSRRTRGVAISYAEPNLRDKMRRPTKELVDAVKGEGKYRRTSNLADEEIAALGEPRGEASEEATAKMVSGLEEQLSRDPPSIPVPEQGDVGSPLAEKGAVGDGLPSSVSTARGKRRSSFMARTSGSEGPAVHKDDGAGAGTGNDTEDSMDISLNSSVGSENSVDVYEFPTNSPSKADSFSTAPPDHAPRQGRGSRRVSTAGHTDLSLEREQVVARSSAMRKRGSVSGSRRSKQELEQVVGEDGGESSIGAGAKDRSMRRRTTML